jgi:hypothetical protein
MRMLRSSKTSWVWIGGLMAVTLGLASVSAADSPGALPGDETLTCDQIYVQGMAEAQRAQQERNQKHEQMRVQSNATAALVVGATAAGGLGGTGQAAQAAVEAQAWRTMAELATPAQPNPRMEQLKQLWAQKQCAKK